MRIPFPFCPKGSRMNVYTRGRTESWEKKTCIAGEDGCAVLPLSRMASAVMSSAAKSLHTLHWQWQCIMPVRLCKREMPNVGVHYTVSCRVCLGVCVMQFEVCVCLHYWTVIEQKIWLDKVNWRWIDLWKHARWNAFSREASIYGYQNRTPKYL